MRARGQGPPWSGDGKWVRYAEQAAEARKKADRLACEAWNKRMLGFQGPAQPSPALSDYQRVGVNESRKIVTFDEFFANPFRNVPESIRSSMIKRARVLPVQYVALIEYQAQDFIGAIIQERATCTFISLEGRDAPTRTIWVKIDNEFNFDWAKRQPNAENFERRMRENM
jgi:hypothetical protein